jgi:hypothetical protein
MDRFFERSGPLSDDQKKNFLAGYLVEDAAKEYQQWVRQSGEFTTYKELQNWLQTHYSTSDPIHTYFDRFFAVKQKEGESFDDYLSQYHLGLIFISNQYTRGKRT